MKLRNKKTGEIVEAESCNSTTGSIGIFYENNHGQLGSKDCFETLAELNEEWEDYKPAEPLIKDEKVRKAVRAWAEANGTSKLTFDGYYILTDEHMNDIEFGTTKPFEELEKGICYTIEELCGDEE